MRNYLFSISVHIVVILLLLFPFLKTGEEPIVHENIVLIDFSQDEDRQRNQESQQKKPIPEVAAAKSPEPAKQKEIVVEKSTTEPQKKMAETIKKTEPKAPETASDTPNSAEVEARLAAEREAELIAAEEKRKEEQQRAEAEQKKKAHFEEVESFTQLLDQSKVQAPAQETSESSETGNQAGLANHSNGTNSQIKGSLGARKILRVPEIVDRSQKKGRVVIQICVGSSGQVISSKYTQIGSTTSDAYLIDLAEEGAMNYLFSPSAIERECGKVVIEFELK